MLSSAYIYVTTPFLTDKKNYIETYNELMIFVCAVLQMVLAGYTIKERQQTSVENPGSIWSLGQGTSVR